MDAGLLSLEEKKTAYGWFLYQEREYILIHEIKKYKGGFKAFAVCTSDKPDEDTSGLPRLPPPIM